MPSLTVALAQVIGSTLPSENFAGARGMADAAAQAGAHMLVLPGLTLLRAWAIENTCYAAGAVLTGKSFIGRSAAFDPFGVPLADGGKAEGLVVFEASSERVSEVRARLPTLEHCRPHVFAEI